MSVEEAIAKRRKAMSGGSARSAGPAGRTKEKKKASWWKIGGIAAGAVSVFGLLVYVAIAPKTGGPMIGICKVFVERSVFYPTTLRYQFITQFPKAVRIGYTYTDGFGQFHLDMAECGFRPDAQIGMVLDSVLLNREDIEQDEVDRFNVGLPAIFENMPDLALLPPLPDDLMELKHDY